MVWKLISNLIPSFKSLPIKLILIAGLVTTLTTFCVWGYNTVYEAGYNKASLEYQKEVSNKVKESLVKAREEWDVEAAKALEVARSEKEIVERTKTVYRDVYRTEYVCEDIGKSAVELLNRVLEEK